MPDTAPLLDAEAAWRLVSSRRRSRSVARGAAALTAAASPAYFIKRPVAGGCEFGKFADTLCFHTGFTIQGQTSV